MGADRSRGLSRPDRRADVLPRHAAAVPALRAAPTTSTSPQRSSSSQSSRGARTRRAPVRRRRRARKSTARRSTVVFSSSGSTTISELPSGSRSQNIGGTGPPKRVTSSSTSTPASFSAAWRAVDVARVEDDPGLGASRLLALRRRGERDRRLGAGDRHLDPAHVRAHRHVDDLLEAERADVEVERPVGVGDRHDRRGRPC